MTSQRILISAVAAMVFTVTGCQHVVEPESRPLRADRKDGSLKPDPSEARFILVSQWHLSPQTTTNLDRATQLPQTENQLAIYHQLSTWVRESGLQTIVAEGCEGKIDEKFKDRFNGWTLDDLEKLSPADLDRAMTHVALKLKAEFRNKLVVICGDNLKLIQKHQLVLSDLRGFLGFKTRLIEAKNDPRRHADYIRALNPLLQLPETTSAAVTEAALNKRLRDSVEAFDQIIRERNKSFLRALHHAMGRTALVIGALHIRSLNEQMHNEGESAAVFEPIGLKGDESLLIDEIRKLLETNL